MPPGSRKGCGANSTPCSAAQAERILRELDVVQREEFEAVKEMARLAREENEALKARIEALEAKPPARRPRRRKDRPPPTDYSGDSGLSCPLRPPPL